MERMGLLVGALAFSLLCACASSGGGKGPVATGDVKAEEARCHSDKDCTLIDDCCGCQGGGMQVGVHVDSVEATRARQAEECQQRTCGTTPSAHRSCSATSARCLGGRCIPAL